MGYKKTILSANGKPKSQVSVKPAFMGPIITGVYQIKSGVKEIEGEENGFPSIKWERARGIPYPASSTSTSKNNGPS